MLKFEWNALRTGDRVLVHDPSSAQMALTPGAVALIDAHKGVNGLGIRVKAQGGEYVVWWPSHLAVHRDPRNPSESCWRCQTSPGPRSPPV